MQKEKYEDLLATAVNCSLDQPASQLTYVRMPYQPLMKVLFSITAVVDVVIAASLVILLNASRTGLTRLFYKICIFERLGTHWCITDRSDAMINKVVSILRPSIPLQLC